MFGWSPCKLPSASELCSHRVWDGSYVHFRRSDESSRRIGVDVSPRYIWKDMNLGQEVNYADAWAEYKRLSRLYLLAVLGFVPCCFAAAYVSLKFLGSPIVGFILATVWMGAFLLLSLRFFNWPCPHCGKNFNSLWLIPTRRCRHCGLRKWEAL